MRLAAGLSAVQRPGRIRTKSNTGMARCAVLDRRAGGKGQDQKYGNDAHGTSHELTDHGNYMPAALVRKATVKPKKQKPR